MSDQTFREIQLSFKQLVFLFMSAVVVLLAVFLLGVSVGRGVGSAAVSQPLVEAQAPEGPVGDPPPPTEPSPGELSYLNALQGQSPPALPATPPAAAEPPVADPVVTGAAPPPDPPAEPVAQGWFVQLGAFGSRRNAETLVATLKKKGYEAFLQTTAPPTPYSVRIGPFTERKEAEAIVARLRKEPEGYTPLITR